MRGWLKRPPGSGCAGRIEPEPHERASSLPAVPRYFLHICNGTGFVEDDEGLELPDREAARHAAMEGLRDITASELRAGQLNMASFIEIEDESGRHVMTIHFVEAVSISTRRGKFAPRPSGANDRAE